MKNYTLLLLLVLVFSSCESFDDPIPEGSSLEVPMLISEIVSPTEVLLTWNSAQICAGFCPSVVPASYYEIWAKSLTSSIDYKLGEAPAGSTTYQIEGLEPGVVQEFFVIAKRANVRNPSNSVMVAPNELPAAEAVFQKEGFDYITHPQVSPDGTEVVYALSDAGAAGSSQNVFLYDLTSKSERLVRENGQYPSWSAGGEKLVFVSEEANSSVLSEFALATGTATQVMDNSYKMHYPLFGEDDETLLYFLDSLEAGESGFMELTETDTAFLHPVEYPENARPTVLGISYSAESSQVVYSTSFPKDTPSGFSYDLVGFRLDNTEAVIDLEVSDWNDTNPSFGPTDSDLLAFVSDRSGMEQVWVKNTTTQQLVQVTDFQDGEQIIVGVVGLSWSGQTLFVNIANAQGTTTLLSIDVSSLL
ncbi:hypothetical protein [Algoriphagus terrigena]|uniref:hypothetical protein n=1 Tax=Algoriphagus terrigena TaxID=344884 RepID=UPI00040AFB45|nr:hypothetical protein [Algoriphagus terrigena]